MDTKEVTYDPILRNDDNQKREKHYLARQWVNTVTDSLQLLHPEMTREEIKKFAIKQFEKNVKDTDVTIHNSYEKTLSNTTLVAVADWLYSTRPLIAESGVYFYPKHVRRNVNVEIIKECMLDARTIHKKEKFKAKEAGDSFLEAVKDIQQKNDKKAANSGYGAEGQSSSFLYNKYSAMSVTASGRGQISTACQCFDNLFSDNVKFFNMDEFFIWVHHIVNEQGEWKYKTYDIINLVPSKEKFIKRFQQKFLHESFYNEEMIEKVYDSLSDELRLRVYYKANIYEFLKNAKPLYLLNKIAFSDADFIDPNDIPKELSIVKELVSIIVEFVNYQYGLFRYEDRTKYQKRSNVIVIDTDSNFIYLGNLFRYIKNTLLPDARFLTEDNTKLYDTKLLNVLACVATDSIKQTLENYTRRVNIAPEDRKWIKMKNEFAYNMVIVTFAKKSYIGLVSRQETHIFKEPELDVKGVNFFKTTASENTTKFIYDEILMNQLLQPKDKKISLKRVYKKIYEYQQQIADKIKQGDMGFLKKDIQVKSFAAYANVLSLSQAKAVYVWNKISDDKDRIDLPNTVTLVKVKIKTKQDLAVLAPYTEVYERLLNLFDTEPQIGGGYVEVPDDLGNPVLKEIKPKGINAIALPNEYEEVPEWMLEIIDVETIVSDNMKLFTQLYRPLGMSKGESTYNGAGVSYYTNIVRI